jgi:hypothetical protein
MREANFARRGRAAGGECFALSETTDDAAETSEDAAESAASRKKARSARAHRGWF